MGITLLRGRFIEEGLGRANELPRLDDHEAVERWMKQAVIFTGSHLRRLGQILEPLELVTLRAAPFIAWNPYADFAELLNFRCGPEAYSIAAKRLRARGFGIEWTELSELTEQFLLRRLPRAVRSFDPLRGAGRERSWLVSVFYRFAVNELISDRINRRHLEQFLHTNQVDTTPEAVLEEKAEHQALSALPQILESLPSRDRLAIELYFGLQGEEHSLAEIAQEFGCSQYLARKAVVHGLARLAAAIGTHGPLDEEEFAILQLTFGEGMELSAAAGHLGISPNYARDVSVRIERKLRRGLRSRTTRQSKQKESVRRRETMQTWPMLDSAQIIRALQERHDPPHLEPDAEGELRAKILDSWVPVARVRQIAAQPDVRKLLAERNVDLDWLAVPDVTMERADLPSDALEWADSLEEINGRSWVVAATLYEYFREKAEHEHADFFTEESAHTVERIHRTLGGIAQAIETEMPQELRRKGTGKFRIDWKEMDAVVGTWEEDTRSLQFDIRSLFVHKAELLGEIPSATGEILARLFIEWFFAGETALPGFYRAEESTRRTVLLRWVPPTTEAELRSVRHGFAAAG